MTDLAHAVVWIIGASSGIGAATAHELSDRGATVVISGRRADQLRQVAGTTMTPIPVDVTDRDAVDAVWRKIGDRIRMPDIVIFSAGIWKQSPPATFEVDDLRAHVDVHLLGLGNVLQVALPAFAERGHGTIATVASVAGFRGIPGGEYYGAVKAAQINLFEALRGAYASAGVRLMTICPGFIDTDLTASNDFPMPFMISAQQAARHICRGLERDRDELTFPARMAVVMKTARVLPTWAWSRLTAR